MKCNKCGAETPEGTKYCMYCGAELDQDMQTAEPQSAPQYTEAQPVQSDANPVPQQDGGYYTAPAASVYQNQYGANPYQQNAAYQPPYYPPQPPAEDKVNVGLVVLSVFIPLAGLILFITQNKDKPKNAKACGLAALISFIVALIASFAGFAAFSTYMVKHADDFSNFEDYDEDFDFDWDDEDSNVYGVFDAEDDHYYNSYFYVDYDLPDGFTFLSYDEIAQDGDYQIDEASGIPYYQDGDSRLYYDSAAVSDDNTALIKTAEVENSNYTDESEVLDFLTDKTLFNGYDNLDIAPYTDMELAGRDFKICRISYTYSGIGGNECFAVSEEDGEFLLIHTAANENANENAYQLLTYYFY